MCNFISQTLASSSAASAPTTIALICMALSLMPFLFLLLKGHGIGVALMYLIIGLFCPLIGSAIGGATDENYTFFGLIVGFLIAVIAASIRDNGFEEKRKDESTQHELHLLRSQVAAIHKANLRPTFNADDGPMFKAREEAWEKSLEGESDVNPHIPDETKMKATVEVAADRINAKKAEEAIANQPIAIKVQCLGCGKKFRGLPGKVASLHCCPRCKVAPFDYKRVKA